MKKENTITEAQVQDLLSTCYSKGVNGIPKVSKSVYELADDYQRRFSSREEAAKSLINHQIAKCATSGFLTGLGGVITLPVAIPANIGSVLYVQMRMVAAIAVIGGYDARDDQVETMVYACLLGQSMSEALKKAGVDFGMKFAKNGIKKIPGEALTKINQAVGFRFVTKFGQKGIVNLGNMVPLVGGVVGGGFDTVTTKMIARNAYKVFIANNMEEDIVIEICK